MAEADNGIPDKFRSELWQLLQPWCEKASKSWFNTFSTAFRLPFVSEKKLPSIRQIQLTLQVYVMEAYITSPSEIKIPTIHKCKLPVKLRLHLQLNGTSYLTIQMQKHSIIKCPWQVAKRLVAFFIPDKRRHTLEALVIVENVASGYASECTEIVTKSSPQQRRLILEIPFFFFKWCSLFSLFAQQQIFCK